MARALLKSWFVDFDPVRAKMEGRDTGLPDHISDLFPDRLVDSELGEIPNGWNVESLKRIGRDMDYGKRTKGGINKDLATGIPSVGAESISSVGNFNFSITKFVTEEFAALQKSGWVKDLDVALYKDGARWNKLSNDMACVSMYGHGFPFEKFVVNEHVFLLRSPRLGQNYLYQVLSTDKVLMQLGVNATAKVAQPGLSKNDVKITKLIVPSKTLCDTYNSFTMPWVKKQLQLGKEIESLENLRNLLLPGLVSGKFCVGRFCDNIAWLNDSLRQFQEADNE